MNPNTVTGDTTRQIVVENILTFEIEDRFHVDSPNMEPMNVRSRIIPILIHLLDRLDSQKVRATFFILGWVARKFPEVVALIDSRGYEVASHGFTHGDVRRMPIEKFAVEIARARQLLEDIIQKPVIGYKASSAFLGRDYLAHYRAMAEAGYHYDCSLFPDCSRMDALKPFSMAVDDQRTIKVIPQSAIRKMGVNVRFGEKSRILPTWFSVNSIRNLNGNGYQAMVNMKLWELDINLAQSSRREYFNYSTYGNLSLAEQKLMRILEEFRFTSCAQALGLSNGKIGKITAY